LGFEPGERLAIIADNIPEWLYAELGTQAVRGISVGVYQSSLPAEIAYMLQYAGASIVLAEDQEQVDKLYEIRSEIPKVRHVIYEDPKGMRSYRDPWLLSFEEVLERGREHRRKYPDAVERLLLEASPEEVCHLSSTSGTTGRPKAAMLRHRNLIHKGVKEGLPRLQGGLQVQEKARGPAVHLNDPVPLNEALGPQGRPPLGQMGQPLLKAVVALFPLLSSCLGGLPPRAFAKGPVG